MDLKRWFYEFKESDRIQVYLTNTLEPSETYGLIPFLRELTEESRIANQIKVDKPILVVLGNPPYSVSSSNKSKWILEKMQDYKMNLKERNIQPLDDDYIKFIRFAQWKIEQNKKGVMGFITNNSYLDGIIHRQMRKSLLDTFDKLYILNLHGSLRRKSEVPNGGRDENVFDIKPGVAIVLFVKNDKFKDKKVFYADLFGTREEKYKWLDRNTIGTVKWTEVKPEAPYYFFIPKDLSLQSEYEKFLKVTEIFKEWSSGIKTHRDDFVVGFTKEEIVKRLKTITGDLPDNLVKERLKLKDTGSWKLADARQKVKGKNLEEEIHPYAYRPFDVRWICYENALIDRDRWPFMRSLLNQNLSLGMTRILAEPPFMHIFISNRLSDICLISSKTKETAYFFPLYRFKEEKSEVNFSNEFIKFIKEKYPNQKITPEEILSYIYMRYCIRPDTGENLMNF